jgi:hypothetical protein
VHRVRRPVVNPDQPAPWGSRVTKAGRWAPHTRDALERSAAYTVASWLT